MSVDLDLSAASEAGASTDTSADVGSSASGASDVSVSSGINDSGAAAAASTIGGAQASDAAAQAQAWSLRGELSALGIDSANHPDDRAAFAAFKTALSQRVADLQQRAQYGDYWQANRQRYESALAAQP